MNDSVNELTINVSGSVVSWTFTGTVVGSDLDRAEYLSLYG